MGRSYMSSGNLASASWITVCVEIVGLAMMLGGAILSGIAYTEVRPNFSDENYNRYIGSNLNRIIGPVMLTFGAVLVVGGCCFLAFALVAVNKNYSRKSPQRVYSGASGDFV